MAKDTPTTKAAPMNGPVRQHYELATTGKCDCGATSHAGGKSTTKK